MLALACEPGELPDKDLPELEPGFSWPRPSISWSWGRSATRPLSASSTNSRTTTYPFLSACSRSARSWAAMDRSTSCRSLETLAYSATGVGISCSFISSSSALGGLLQRFDFCPIRPLSSGMTEGLTGAPWRFA